MCTATTSSYSSLSIGNQNNMSSQRSSAAQIRQELRDLDLQRKALEEEIALLSGRLNAPGQPGIKGSLLDKQGFPRADIDVVQVRRDRNRIICLTNDQKALTDELAKLLGDLHEAVRSEGTARGGSSSSQRNGMDHMAVNGNGNGAAGTVFAASESACGAAGGSGVGETTGVSQPVIAVAAAVDSVGGGAAAMVVDDADGATTASDRCASSCVLADSARMLAPFALVDEVSGGSPAEAAGLQVGDLLCSFGDVSAAASSASSGPATGSLLQQIAAVLGASEGRPVTAQVLRQGTALKISLTPARWSGRGLLGCHLRPL
ncbi:hypothetical protein Vretimale_9128 [Volvox reticuliferus]|uniref:Nas2 N-terminal domain-containing protein n=1 Tax=Volvox reticuliferus TaxID=1737510 RepID=A0A8J4LQ15_9CHLO|nr:hypothetical protein Vretifemale_9816 [Volvox reticuliferus]GIM04578.1 hypothetical protein Vretimale_9128 [Volvox reticuliferus]